MTYAFYGDYHHQETAETDRRYPEQDCVFVSQKYREAYGFQRVKTCRNCCNLDYKLFPLCTRFSTLPGIKDMVMAYDDMVCDFWGIPDAPRDTALQNEWARQVYERDNYTCQKCGLKGVLPSTNYVEQEGRTFTVLDPGLQLYAHHIKPYALFPKLAWALDNSVTLCENCHRKAHEHGIDIYPAESKAKEEETMPQTGFEVGVTK
jgi:hypothetical protein